MPVHQQIKQFVESMKVNRVQLAKDLESNSTTLSNVLRGKYSPSADFLTRFALRFRDINCRWLLTGEGDMLVNAEPTSIFTEVKELEIKLSATEGMVQILKDQLDDRKAQLADKDKLISILERQLKKELDSSNPPNGD